MGVPILLFKYDVKPSGNSLRVSVFSKKRAAFDVYYRCRPTFESSESGCRASEETQTVFAVSLNANNKASELQGSEV
jgi:hypothetical protein